MIRSPWPEGTRKCEPPIRLTTIAALHEEIRRRFVADGGDVTKLVIMPPVFENGMPVPAGWLK